MAAEKWSAAAIPDQSGRVILITGANSGIGLAAAKALARRGARVLMACRSPERGQQALDGLRAELGDIDASLVALDLADLSSVRACAERVLSEHARLDALINNAGVMALPRRATADGFEMQLGTNHLGHFALTGLLLERLIASAPARVVTVSSIMHRYGAIDFDDLQSERRYSKWGAYGQSKLANLLFTYELHRRAAARGVLAAACHPGYAATNLQFKGPAMSGSRLSAAFMRIGNRVLAQDQDGGALPTLYAATDPSIEGGEFIGPGGMGELKGPPTRVKSNARSHDVDAARRLWEVSVELTGVTYDALN